MRKPLFLSLLFLLLLFSCEKEKRSFQDYNIRLADHLFSGEKIGTVSFDEKQGAWIAGGSKLIHYSGNKTESINIGSAIYDIAVDKKGNVWVGTKDKGLVCYDQRDLKFFNKENSGFPRDLISEVLVDNNNIAWFSSAAHQLGGLMRYDGKTFQLFTPENSPLEKNVVSNLELGPDNTVYFVSYGTVTKTTIYRIYKDQWDIVADNIYWIFEMTVDHDGNIYFIEDFALSSSSYNTNTLYKVSNTGKREMITDDYTYIPFQIAVDNHGYLWGFGGYTGKILRFFDGKEWHNTGLDFPDIFAYNMKVDNENNIWLCTNDGIFIIKTK